MVNLVIATHVAAQPAPRSTAATPPTSLRDDDVAVLGADSDSTRGDLPTKLRLPLFNRIYPPPDRFAGDATSGTFNQQGVRPRDSLANGAVIGAVIGAAAFSVFAAILCKAYQEEGGASCLPDTLRFAAIGGAIGGGVGLAIDAARSQRRITVRIAVRF